MTEVMGEELLLIDKEKKVAPEFIEMAVDYGAGLLISSFTEPVPSSERPSRR